MIGIKTAERKIMKKETKQTLISLSLAGVIGYYLYNKIIKAGMGPTMQGQDYEPAVERTKRELNWRPEPVVEEPVREELIPEAPMAEEITKDEMAELETPVLDTPMFEEPVVLEEAEVEDKVEEPANDEEMLAENEPEHDDPYVCANCGNVNAEEDKFCQECGAALPVVGPEQLESDNVADVAKSDTAEDMVVVPAVDEFEMTPIIAPTLDLETLNIEIPGEGEMKGEEPELIPEEEEERVEEVVEEEPPKFEEPAELLEMPSLDENEEETSLDDLFETAQENEQPEGEQPEEKVMDNVEPLHKVDNKDESAKEEFKSILDFFNTI